MTLYERIAAYFHSTWFRGNPGRCKFDRHSQPLIAFCAVYFYPAPSLQAVLSAVEPNRYSFVVCAGFFVFSALQTFCTPINGMINLVRTCQPGYAPYWFIIPFIGVQKVCKALKINKTGCRWVLWWVTHFGTLKIQQA